MSNVPAGSFEKMVLVVSAGGQERSALVTEQLVIDKDGGASWANP